MMRSSAVIRSALASFGFGGPANLTFRHCYMPFGIHWQQPLLPISTLRVDYFREHIELLIKLPPLEGVK
ncbi:hypothetical protein ABKV19_002790 [Rosa sericea]